MTVERVGIDEALGILGRKKRVIERKAQAGDIPGAVKLWGRWTFDPELLRAMVRDEEKRQWADKTSKIRTRTLTRLFLARWHPARSGAPQRVA